MTIGTAIVVPHWFGSTGDGPAELLSIFGRPGERMQVRSPAATNPSRTRNRTSRRCRERAEQPAGAGRGGQTPTASLLYAPTARSGPKGAADG